MTDRQTLAVQSKRIPVIATIAITHGKASVYC